MSSIAIIGCGNIGFSIAEGLIASDKKTAKQIIATKRNLSSLKCLQEKGVEITSSNKQAIKNAKYIIIAVKPFKVEEVLSEISSSIKKRSNYYFSCVRSKFRKNKNYSKKRHHRFQSNAQHRNINRRINDMYLYKKCKSVSN